jgi:hypothetical protein
MAARLAETGNAFGEAKGERPARTSIGGGRVASTGEGLAAARRARTPARASLRGGMRGTISGREACSFMTTSLSFSRDDAPADGVALRSF